MTKNRRKVSLKYHSLLYLLIFALTAITVKVTARSPNRPQFYNILTALSDTIPPQSVKKIPDSARLNKQQISDTVPVKNDSGLLIQRVDTMNIKMSADSMDAPVNYKAQDSMVLEVDTKRILLYGKTEVKYTDVTLTAPTLVFDQADQVVTARMGKDSSGTVLGLAKLVQAQTTTVSDSIRFNFKTQKGLTYSSFFQQDEIYNYAEKVKKIDAQTFYASGEGSPPVTWIRHISLFGLVRQSLCLKK